MRIKILTVAVILALLSLPEPARSSTDVPNEVNVGCEAVSVALTALGGYAIGAPFGGFASAMTVAVTSRYGLAGMTAGCVNYYRSLQNVKENFDYNRFVETVCGGSPYACPNGFNSMGQFPGTPHGCDTFIVCNVPLAVRQNASLTVNDLINAGTFVDLSRRSGFWEFNRYGYLVGLTSIGGGGDYLDPR